MLALTPTAAEVVDSIVSQQELPDTAGLRITSEEGGAPAEDSAGSQRDLRLAVVEQPEAGDALVAGTQVYVEPGETAELLEDKVLDAEVEGNEVRFSIAQQAGPDGG
jgi:Fe-S cluster assembly iron-binding protein IscA